MKKMIRLLSVALIVGLLSSSLFAAEVLKMKLDNKSHFAGDVSGISVVVNDDESIDLFYTRGDYETSENHFDSVTKTIDDQGVVTYRHSFSEPNGVRESFTLVDSRNAVVVDAEKSVKGSYRSGFGWCGTMDFSINFSLVAAE